MRKIGFSIDEVMSGYHEFEFGWGTTGRHPMEFRATWGSEDLVAFLNPFGNRFLQTDLHGTISVGGMCDSLPCHGTLSLRYFSDRSIRYVLWFQVDGRAYRYVGEKVNILPWNLPVSHTTCFGTLVDVDTGRLVSRSVAFFRLRLIPEFLGSFRLLKG